MHVEKKVYLIKLINEPFCIFFYQSVDGFINTVEEFYVRYFNASGF